MKSKKIVGLTLVTLLAPTFLNAHVALAESAPVEVTPTSETAPAAEETDSSTAPVAATPAPVEVAPPAPTPVPVPEETTPPTEETTPPVVEETTPSTETPVVTPEETAPPVENTDDSTTNSSAIPVPVETTPQPAADPNTPDPTPTPTLPIPPVTGDEEGSPYISVAPVKTIQFGSDFDPLKGIFAYDADGTDITNKIKVISNNVNTNIPTSSSSTPYQVVYSVTNAAEKTTTATVSVYVEAERVGFLTATVPDITVAQNGSYEVEIAKNIVVRDPYGAIATPDQYTLAYVGGIYVGEPGTHQITLLVISNTYGTITEVTVNVTIIKGLTLEASDQTLFLGETFDPMANVSATETKADGSTVSLGDYNGNTDTGISYSGNVDTSTPGVYPVTYSAKNSAGIIEMKTVNINVKASELTVTAQDFTIVQGQNYNASDYVTVTDEKDDRDGVPVEIDIIDNVDKNTVGTYPIVYTATNSSGVSKTATATVTVTERLATIEASDQVAYQDQAIDETTILSWATVSDPVDAPEDLTVTYTVTPNARVAATALASIDTTTVGASYTVNYTVTNTAGNLTSKSINVTVEERFAEIIAPDYIIVSPGDVIDDETILSWATASDVVDGDNLPVTEYTIAGGQTIDTSKPGSQYQVTYTYTNSAGNVTEKTITVTVAALPAPTIVAEDKVMYVGDKISEDIILSWATATNAEQVGFEVAGAGIPYNAVDNTLIEAGEYQITFTAYSGLETTYLQTAQATMTLTVKERSAVKPVNNKNVETKTVKSGEKALPATGEKENGMLASVLGLSMIATVYFMKKKREDEFNLY